MGRALNKVVRLYKCMQSKEGFRNKKCFDEVANAFVNLMASEFEVTVSLEKPGDENPGDNTFILGSRAKQKGKGYKYSRQLKTLIPGVYEPIQRTHEFPLTTLYMSMRLATAVDR